MGSSISSLPHRVQLVFFNDENGCESFLAARNGKRVRAVPSESSRDCWWKVQTDDSLKGASMHSTMVVIRSDHHPQRALHVSKEFAAEGFAVGMDNRAFNHNNRWCFVSELGVSIPNSEVPIGARFHICNLTKGRSLFLTVDQSGTVHTTAARPKVCAWEFRRLLQGEDGSGASAGSGVEDEEEYVSDEGDGSDSTSSTGDRSDGSGGGGGGGRSEVRSSDSAQDFSAIMPPPPPPPFLGCSDLPWHDALAAAALPPLASHQFSAPPISSLNPVSSEVESQGGVVESQGSFMRNGGSSPPSLSTALGAWVQIGPDSVVASENWHKTPPRAPIASSRNNNVDHNSGVVRGGGGGGNEHLNNNGDEDGANGDDIGFGQQPSARLAAMLFNPAFRKPYHNLRGDRDVELSPLQLFQPSLPPTAAAATAGATTTTTGPVSFCGEATLTLRAHIPALGGRPYEEALRVVRGFVRSGDDGGGVSTGGGSGSGGDAEGVGGAGHVGYVAVHSSQVLRGGSLVGDVRTEVIHVLFHFPQAAAGGGGGGGGGEAGGTGETGGGNDTATRQASFSIIPSSYNTDSTADSVRSPFPTLLTPTRSYSHCRPGRAPTAGALMLRTFVQVHRGRFQSQAIDGMRRARLHFARAMGEALVLQNDTPDLSPPPSLLPQPTVTLVNTMVAQEPAPRLLTAAESASPSLERIQRFRSEPSRVGVTEKKHFFWWLAVACLVLCLCGSALWLLIWVVSERRSLLASTSPIWQDTAVEVTKFPLEDGIKGEVLRDVDVQQQSPGGDTTRGEQGRVELLEEVVASLLGRIDRLEEEVRMCQSQGKEQVHSRDLETS